MTTAPMVGLRVYLCFSSSLSAALALWNNSTDPLNLAAITLLLAFSLLGVADTVVNDVLSKRWRLPFTEKLRHDGYLTLAVVNLYFIFVAVSNNVVSADLLRYGLDAVVCVYVAFRDVKLRFIDPRKEGLSHAEHRP